MGEMSGGGNNPQQGIQQDLGVAEPSNTSSDDHGQATNAPDGQFATDVADIYADGTRGNLPVFDVEPDEFFKNMKMDRRRMRFTPGSKAQKYHSQSKYRRPFWVRNKNDGYLYKVK